MAMTQRKMRHASSQMGNFDKGVVYSHLMLTTGSASMVSGCDSLISGVRNRFAPPACELMRLNENWVSEC